MKILRTCFTLGVLILASSAWSQTRSIKVSVVDKGTFKEVVANYDPATGDTSIVVNGTTRKFSSVYPATGPEYAMGRTWYFLSERVTLNGQPYKKYGLLRVLGANEIKPAGTFDGVTVFAELGSKAPHDFIYVPARSGGEFQPYRKAFPSCGELRITPDSQQHTSGKPMTFKAEISQQKANLTYDWIYNYRIYPGQQVSLEPPAWGDMRVELHVYSEAAGCESFKTVVLSPKTK